MYLQECNKTVTNQSSKLFIISKESYIAKECCVLNEMNDSSSLLEHLHLNWGMNELKSIILCVSWGNLVKMTLVL